MATRKFKPENLSGNRHQIEITQKKPSRTSNGWTIRFGTTGGKFKIVPGFRGTTRGEVRGFLKDIKKQGADSNVNVMMLDQRSRTKHFTTIDTLGNFVSKDLTSPKSQHKMFHSKSARKKIFGK